MLILGIDTASAQVGCALGGVAGILASVELNGGQRHAEQLVPAVQFACRAGGVELSEVGAVAVDVGPGLFTGLRVGVATAKALGLALSVPLIAVCSLDVVAFAVRQSRRTVVVALDARRGEVFHAWYEPSGAGVGRVSEPAVGPPADVRDRLAATDREVLVVGDGALRYSALLGPLDNVALGGRDLALPRAAALVELVASADPDYARLSPDEVAPVYLRQPDAEANWVQRSASARLGEPG